MSYKKITGILLFVVGIQSIAFSQVSTVINMPQIVPPPADAASLGKYGSVPVSMFTGSPDISVPLYEVKTPRLSLPVTLNYSATGIKVDDIASWVGLEWSLNAGGVITRTVRGSDDFGQNGYYSTTVPLASSVNSQNSWSFFSNYMMHIQDSEPDYFFFNFGNFSGKFFFGEDKKPVIVNYQQPLKVQYVNSSQSFLITDEKGNNYYFGAQEINTLSGDYHGAMGNFYTSSWYLSKIVSFDRMDSISFSYYGDVMLEQDFESYTETIGPYFQGANYYVSGHDYSTGEPYTKSSPLRLQEIDYKNGKVVLFSSSTRTGGGGAKLDSLIAYNYDYVRQQYGQVKKIQLNYGYYFTNQQNQPSISHNPYRMRLDSLSINGVDGSSGGKYKFAYDPSMLPWINSNGRDMFGYYNGAITNSSLVPTQTASFATAVYNVGAANRATDPNYIQAGILKSITYPTGGHTDFNYEPNSYSVSTPTTQTIGSAMAFGVTHQRDTSVFVMPAIGGQPLLYIDITPYNFGTVHTIPFAQIMDLTNGQIAFNEDLPDPNNGIHVTVSLPVIPGHTYQCIAGAFDDGRVSSHIYFTYLQLQPPAQGVYGGGLRIQQVTDYDFNGKFLKSDVYKYGQNESGNGIITAPDYLFNTNSYVANFSYPVTLSNITGSAISYRTTQREIFTGSCIYDAFSLGGAPVAYPQVTKYSVDSMNNNIGKSVFNYDYYNQNIMVVSQFYQDGLYMANTGWAGGHLLLDEEYANKGGIYWPVSRTYHSYITPSGTQGRGLKLGFKYIFQGTPNTDSIDVADGVFGQLYYWFDYPIYSGTVLPSTESDYVYDQNDSTIYAKTTKQLSYDNLDHLQPTVVQSNLSDGGTLVTVNRYPAEVDSVSNLTAGEIAAIDSLQSRHNVTALIQSQTLRNGSPVNLVRYDYQVGPGNLVVQDSVEAQVGSYAMEKKIQFNSYDLYGNVLQDARASDINNSYIWDYNNSFPIAAVSNAAQADIAYTSFEADGTGSWSIGSSLRDTSYAITGRRSYNLSNGACSRSGLTASTTYIVSYWSKTGSSFSVTGSTAVKQGKTIALSSGTWTYFEHTVSGTSSLSVTGAGNIDELRVYPVNAQMKTFTYSPLVGMTNQCDADNRISYYYYDGLGRLRYSKDQDGNIIKTIEYHFMGQ